MIFCERFGPSPLSFAIFHRDWGERLREFSHFDNSFKTCEIGAFFDLQGEGIVVFCTMYNAVQNGAVT